MANIFVALYDYFHNHRKAYWLTLIILLCLCIAGASKIRFESDINKMIPQEASINAMNEVLNKTKTGEQLVFTVSFRDSSLVDADSLITFQQQLQDSIVHLHQNDIKLITAQIDDEKEQAFTHIAIQYLPILLDEADYQTIDTLLQPERIATNIEKQRKLLLSPAGMVAKDWISNDPIGILPLAFQKLKSIQFDPNYELYNGYILSKDNKRLTFFVELNHSASATSQNKSILAHIDHTILQLEQQYPQLHISYFGGPAVAAANAHQMQQDTVLTLSITIVLLLALTYYVFRKKRAPFLLILPVIFGALFGLSITALIQGTLSIIALGVGAIILGIAIDFSIHFLSHARTHSPIRENVRTLVFPLTLGALTTIGAFAALRWAHAPLLKDLGLFAACSLAGASLFTLIFLPHLLDNNSINPHTKPNFIDQLAQYKPEKNKYLLAFVLLATPIMFYFSKKVSFNSDLMQLNYMSPKLQQAQKELNEHNSYALNAVYVVAKGNTNEVAAQKMEHAMPTIEKLIADGKIKAALTPAQLIPSIASQQQKIARWNQYWTAGKKVNTLHTVQAAALSNGFSANAYEPFAQTLQQIYQPYDSSTQAFLEQIIPNNISHKGQEHYYITALKVPPEARQKVLQAFQQQTEVTATDRQTVTEKLLNLLQHDFNNILLLSGGLVFVALLIAYGRIELALISFLPMAITWIWILGIMAMLGLQFNIVNIIITTLIFGLGDDYSIFMMDSLMERYRHGKTNIKSARSAIYLSVLTTIIGLGTLAFAEHPALQSIAFIAVLGLVCVVFISQVLQPFLFNFFIQHRADKGFMPFTLWSFIKSVFAFSYFFLGCIIVTLCGLVLLQLKPLGERKSKLLFHRILSFFTGSVIRTMKNLNVKFYTLPNSFNKPAIYIANHASFLDILLTTMLNPKLVLLTNKWVWRSPAFGKIVRMAEYYPVADGAEDSIEPLKNLINRGYSIVVFPEGTRTYDDQITRFHKGAFYIAEQLQLDIIPIVLHGVHYAMQKGDFLLKNGKISLQMLPPISINDTSFGNDYKTRSKTISRHFKAAFQSIKQKQETPTYFKEQLIRSYTYKGPVLEWYCRIKSGLEGYYETFHNLLPRSGTFYDLGCGNGFMTYMLHWAAEDRYFIGVDYDGNKISTAQHNYLRHKAYKTQLRKVKAGLLDAETLIAKTPGIQFEEADITQYQLEACDGIIISDVLHYLLPEQQQQVLDRCYVALNADGVLIIRDGVAELFERHKGTQRTEKWSTKIVNFNKTQNELHFITQAFITNWAAAHHMQLSIIDNTKKTSNLIFVLKK
jgi:1-acyl-sn-glycerol-3-phosphate acyltransferase